MEGGKFCLDFGVHNNALRFAKEKHVTTPYISTLYALISDS